MTLAILIVVVLINAGGRAMYYSAAQAIVPELVRSDALEHANGVLSGTEAGAEQLAGPVVGTWLFAVNKAIPFFADAVVTVLSCIPLVGFRSKAPQPEGASDSMWEGVRLLFADRRLRVLLFMVGSLAGLQGMEGGILVLLATKEWGVADERVRALPGGRRGGDSGREPVGKPVGSPFRERPDPDRSRARLGCRLPGHGGGRRLATGRSRLRRGRSGDRSGVRRRHLAPSAAHPSRSHGTGGRRLAWHRLGRRPVGALVAGGVATIVGLRVPLVLAGALQCAVGVLLARPLLHSLQVGNEPTG